MEKVRIHELAKVLNTNSKRIIEKLNEIDIHPKGPMSYLEPDEYNRLRHHLGMPPIDAQTKDNTGAETSDAVKTPVSRPKQTGLGQSNNIKSNNIIKRRIITHEDDNKSSKSSGTGGGTSKRTASGSGLRAGYVTRDDSELSYSKNSKSTAGAAKKQAVKKEEKIKNTELNEKDKEEVAVKTVTIDENKENIRENIISETNPSDDYDNKENKEDISFKENVPEISETLVFEEKKEEAVPEKKEEKLKEENKDDEILDLIIDEEDNLPIQTLDKESVVKDLGKQETAGQDQKNDRQGYKNGYQQRNNNSGGYQQRNSEGYQQRNNNSGGYQQRNSDGYQQRNNNSGGYQQRNSDGYQQRNNNSGGYRQRSSDGYQQRNNNSGGYRQRNSEGYQQRGNSGGYNNRENDRGNDRGSYQQRGSGSYQQRSAGGYVPGKDDEDDRPAYMKKQSQRKEEGKSDTSVVAKTDINAKKDEAMKEAQAREQEKFIKRENKRENAPKNAVVQNKQKRSSNKVDVPFVGEKKGVNEVFSDDFVLEGISAQENAKFKKNKNKKNTRRNEPTRAMIPPVIAVLTNVTLPESMTVKDLAESLKKTSAEIMKKMLLMGIMANLNQVIDFVTAEIVADEFGIKAIQEIVVTEEDVLFDDADDGDDEDAVTRPPVVVVMGHVDHGKTSLLDAIRSAHVVTGEAGGITQHIGAYTVNLKDRDITFLDTPGHEAFTSMRARGAQTTDIAILVVAADDGVMPQTVESINHAKAAKVSIIVAVNKIDKPGANVEKVMQELTEHGIVAEEWGGETIFVPVSAKKHENIDTLLEMVLLTADVMELKANPTKQPKGTIIEAKLDKNRGPVATVLVQRGTLRLGDSVVTGTTVGRIRAMTDDKGAAIKEAGPSIPVEILGLPEVPQAGEVFYGITDERLAKQLAEKRKVKIKEEQSKSKSMVSLDDLFNQIKEGNIKEINIIVKADVQGSVEAVKQSLEKLSNEDVRVKIIHGGVGAINESDITLAQVSNAMIIGFNVRPGANVQTAAEEAGVDMRLYTIIYNAIEDVSSAMKGMLDPTFKEVIQGHAQIRQIYKVSGIGTIAGCYVTDGKITRNSNIRLLRDNIVVHEGKLASLKRFKDDVKEVLTNFECGLSVERYNDIKEDDVIESYIIEEVKRD